MVLHGGGWLPETQPYFRQARNDAARFAARYRTFNATYSGGYQSLSDANADYEQVRRIVGPDTPICLMGMSADGHLVLLVAEAHPDVACVISESGPTDLTMATGALHVVAAAAFGYSDEALRAASPALHTNRLSAPVLAGYATNDPVVPMQHARALAGAHRDTTIVELPDGDGGGNDVHRQVDRASLAAYYAAEQSFVATRSADWLARRDGVPAVAPAAEIPAAGAAEPVAAKPAPAAQRKARPTPRSSRARWTSDRKHRR